MLYMFYLRVLMSVSKQMQNSHIHTWMLVSTSTVSWCQCSWNMKLPINSQSWKSSPVFQTWQCSQGLLELTKTLGDFTFSRDTDVFTRTISTFDVSQSHDMLLSNGFFFHFTPINYVSTQLNWIWIMFHTKEQLTVKRWMVSTVQWGVQLLADISGFFSLFFLSLCLIKFRQWDKLLTFHQISLDHSFDAGCCPIWNTFKPVLKRKKNCRKHDKLIL